MLLRSSSTPLFGSLLSSFPESSSHSGNHFHDVILSPLHSYHSINMVPSNHHHHVAGCVNMAAVSANSSPMSPSLSSYSTNGFRRAQSEGNLNCLAAAYSSYGIDEERPKPNVPKIPRVKTTSVALERIPSFPYGLDSGPEEEDDGDTEESGDVLAKDEHLHKHDSLDSCMGLTSTIVTEHLNVEERAWSAGNREKLFQEMYVAEDFGIGGGLNSGYGGRNGGRGGAGGGGDNFGSRFTGGDGDEINQTEENYKRMLKEDPSNPLILRNYAEFLHKSKRDLPRAEEYCSRAILADPKDGELLALYAQLSWNLHHDEVKAVYYFTRASKASPENSHVHAAYARFLWEVEEEENHCHVQEGLNPASSRRHQGRMASTKA